QGSFIRIELPVIAPYDWSQIFGFLRNHGIAGVESFAESGYRRVLSIDGSALGALEIRYDPARPQLVARISITDPIHLRGAIERIRDVFDTRLNPHTHLVDFPQEDPVVGCYRET